MKRMYHTQNRKYIEQGLGQDLVWSGNSGKSYYSVMKRGISFYEIYLTILIYKKKIYRMNSCRKPRTNIAATVCLTITTGKQRSFNFLVKISRKIENFLLLDTVTAPNST